MGLDLTLLPLTHLSEKTDGSLWGYCHSQLYCPQQRAAFDAIRELKPEPLPKNAVIKAYVANRGKEDPGYGQLKATPYGNPYTWIEAGKLAKVLRKFPPQAAEAAYLALLPPDAKVILHWH